MFAPGTVILVIGKIGVGVVATGGGAAVVGTSIVVVFWTGTVSILMVEVLADGTEAVSILIVEVDGAGIGVGVSVAGIGTVRVVCPPVQALAAAGPQEVMVIVVDCSRASS